MFLYSLKNKQTKIVIKIMELFNIDEFRGRSEWFFGLQFFKIKYIYIYLVLALYGYVIVQFSCFFNYHG